MESYTKFGYLHVAHVRFRVIGNKTHGGGGGQNDPHQGEG